MSEINRSCDCEERVNHIRCEVRSCAYNNQMDCCEASMINVAPDCCGDGETCCMTFRNKEH